MIVWSGPPRIVIHQNLNARLNLPWNGDARRSVRYRGRKCMNNWLSWVIFTCSAVGRQELRRELLVFDRGNGVVRPVAVLTAPRFSCQSRAAPLRCKREPQLPRRHRHRHTCSQLLPSLRAYPNFWNQSYVGQRYFPLENIWGYAMCGKIIGPNL